MSTEVSHQQETILKNGLRFGCDDIIYVRIWTE